jgi:drug/metabolite transporter (DMT)-like permease
MFRSSPLLAGAGLRLLAAFLITAMSAVVHAVSGEVSLGQIIFWRSAVALVPICAYMALRGEFPRAMRSARPWLHATRGLFGAASMAMSFLSLAYLPVANAEALAYLAPVLTVPLAALALREKTGPLVWIATAAGFGGVLAMLWSALEAPGEGAQIGVVAGLGFAVTTAFVRVHIKTMTVTEGAATIAFWFAVTSALVGLATLPFGWEMPGGRTILLLILTGLLGGLAHIAGTEAIARAPVSVLAPYDFTGMIWALGFDLLLFQIVPDGFGMLGVAAIMVAALLVSLPRRAPGLHRASVAGSRPEGGA